VSNGLAAAEAKMRDGGVSELGIAAFRRLYGLLEAGDRGLLPTAELTPATGLPSYESLPAAGSSAALDRAVVIKLNGGLGTTMGLAGPKSLIEVKPGVSFLDVIARQVLHLRATTGARLPLVLMNSFATRDASLAALDRHRELASAGVPADFVQHREPRLRADTLAPVDLPHDRPAEWCPPGHGDLYAAVAASGMLATLRANGFRYAFVSNADNLGAALDPRVIEWFAGNGIPFAMEVIEGTAADRKGGHIAVRDGQLVLRETAQVPDSDAASFRDYTRWKYYNTNNLYVDLDALASTLDSGGGVLPLTLIVNRKSVPDAGGAPVEVIQLETAMGAAIGVIPGARALVVPRTRFAPVKSTADLLVVRSDFYTLGADGQAVPADPSGRPPVVDLDPEFFKVLPDFEARFPGGAPSLRRARSLTVRGDVHFGEDVTVVGDVTVEGPAKVPDGTVLGE
jgi:UTP--glucose-1-phosphate uridylyltransferase